MKPRLAMALILILLIGMLSVVFNGQRVKAGGTIYIRADGAVEGATCIRSNDNVTYVLTEDINDSITVERNNITVDGNTHTVQGLGEGYGFNLTAVSNVTIKNANVMGFLYGFCLSHSNYNSILENNITECGAGINIEGGFSWESSSKGNSVIRNNITRNDQGIQTSGADSCNVTENSVTENRGAGIIVRGSDNAVTGNNVTQSGGTGILLHSSSNALLRNNRMSNNSHNFGVDMTFFPSGLQNYVDASNLVDGKPVYYWTYVQDRSVPLNAGCVILLNCRNMTIENLTLERNKDGIIMGYVTDSTIAWNNITNNGGSGIWLIESSGNEFYENNLVKNYAGVWFNWAEGNHFYHNNFILNTHYQAYTQTSENSWDDGYPSGGNYWKPHFITADSSSGQYQNETGCDGIDDTPYVIDSNNTDRYPLMGMFQNYDVTYYTLLLVAHSCNVTVISNSTVSNFAAPIWIEHPEVILIEFNVTEEQGTTGFCRVSFPTAMMNGTYHVFVNGTEAPYTLLPCSNADYSHLYFTYTHSTEGVIIIPEFPSFLILPTFMAVTLLAGIFYRRKHAT